ncbi:hypothetical protein EJ06DRAFT_488238 [Trichodelitschia bisporula]|uniref:DUF6590 domain-containing protein n=1 Tax=Trichodelitschia bisporula TaxID=703511 RepID=A0A6G1I5R8_9PEZI|nr:hypothetical protein EJ06DRAFT_488238 [Trichodelitschia bisporula]
MSWIWDPARQEQYFYSHEQQRYIYQSEYYQIRNVEQYETPQDFPPVNASVAFNQVPPGASNYGIGAYQMVPFNSNPSNVYYGSSGNLLRSHRDPIHGTPERGQYEQLDDRYRIPQNQADFFVRGRVFRMLWSEPHGGFESRTVYTTTSRYGYTPDTRFGEGIYTKIRWFVVIRPGRPGDNFSNCLPIQTYGGQGVGKEGVTKGDHSIIHTGRPAPRHAPNEEPAYYETGMRGPIEVVADRRSDSLDVMSRLHYARTYTVEHNVKVWGFGRVHEDSLDLLWTNFTEVQFQR